MCKPAHANLSSKSLGEIYFVNWNLERINNVKKKSVLQFFKSGLIFKIVYMIFFLFTPISCNTMLWCQSSTLPHPPIYCGVFPSNHLGIRPYKTMLYHPSTYFCTHISLLRIFRRVHNLCPNSIFRRCCKLKDVIINNDVWGYKIYSQFVN